LTQLGVEFEVVEPDVEELSAGNPREVVVENALRKARSVEGSRVLGVDTDVVLDGRVFGKPASVDAAREQLLALSARVHEVFSGIALKEGESERTAVSVTRVHFRSLDPSLLDWYLASGEWEGRAGGYAIQGRGAALVERIEGDFWNVVGLPVPELLKLAPDLAQ
jgi:septum formation protein